MVHQSDFAPYQLTVRNNSDSQREPAAAACRSTAGLYTSACHIIQPDCLQENGANNTYDVVASFHQRNRAPRAPDANRLRAIRLIGQSNHRRGSLSDSDDSESDTASLQGQRKRVPRNSRKAYNANSEKPTQLRFYPTQWRRILSRAQDLCRLWMVMECAYPNKDKSEHRDAFRARLHQALHEHQQRGGRVEEGPFCLDIKMQALNQPTNQGIFRNTKRV